MNDHGEGRAKRGRSLVGKRKREREGRKEGRKEGREGEKEKEREKKGWMARTRHYVGDEEGEREGASDPWAVINNSKE